jgi:lipoprotein-anchoring transpeptidase ErfK/SrfK
VGVPGEVQGIPANGVVASRTWKSLERPKSPAQHNRRVATRIEVNLKMRVLVLYHDHRVELISHISSGGGYYFCNPGGGCAYADTPTGTYHTTVYMSGWVTVPLGEMYNPVFFIGTSYAIHGETDVPVNPISHGCVRIPMDVAGFFHKLVKTPGTEVIVYN